MAESNEHPLLNDDYESTRNSSQTSRHYLAQKIFTRHTDLILILCFGINGLIDSGSYNAYQCFVCMITGNTIFAALGMSSLPVQAPRYQWTKSLSSIFAFLLGYLIFSNLHRLAGRKRWIFVASFILQSILIAISAFLVSRGQSSERYPHETVLPPPFPWIDSALIALLSFQTAGKVVASRMLKLTQLPTNVLSMMYNDLISDPAILSPGNIQQNRRIGGLVVYIAGPIAGGASAKSHAGFGGLLWIAAGLSLAIALGWLVWRESSPEINRR
ncbi:hypothetical protein EJ03DRAFT_280972 [Teratosphaeria nubilosa]|uniref:DUF1275 domain protein n=1 Tax=Teratosphaeria nubilosa TaxID=161662 RepID=A0A6G1KWH2_9PEZI|nr:hypothetical protein EJ03DRAFT_280972 [Teratosphaeria nubilosa]